MRALNILCGVAVLLNSLHFVHAIDHFSHQAGRDGFHGPGLWTAIAAAIVIGMFSFVGGFLLLKRAR
jgi:hypothetical protein